MPDVATRSRRLDRAIADLLVQAPEVEAAAVVSFDGLPMASALPATMDEDRVAAMSAALLSLGERAAEGLGRGALSQVYIEGEHGTVFLVSAEDEAVLVAVASRGAKVGMMMYEVRRAAESVADALRQDDVDTAGASAAATWSDSTAAADAAGVTAATGWADQPLEAAVQPVAEALTQHDPASTYQPLPVAAPVSADSPWPGYSAEPASAPAVDPPSWS